MAITLSVGGLFFLLFLAAALGVVVWVLSGIIFRQKPSPSPAPPPRYRVRLDRSDGGQCEEHTCDAGPRQVDYGIVLSLADGRTAIYYPHRVIARLTVERVETLASVLPPATVGDALKGAP